jgi:hypothetical protein
MVVLPLPNPINEPKVELPAVQAPSNDWLRYAAGGSLIASGILLLSGKHRAGLLAAATGTALVMLDQQDTVEAWWFALPGLIDNAGRMLNQVEGVLDSVDAQRARIRAMVKK